MGFFSGSTTTYIFANSVDLMDDPPKSVQMAVMQSVVGGEDLGTELINMTLSGAAMRFKTAFRYAEKHYTYGLPQGETEFLGGNEEAVKAQLEMDIGRPIIMESYAVGRMTASPLAINWAVVNRGLDTADLQVRNHPFVDDYLTSDMPITFVRAESTDNTNITLHYSYVKTITTCSGFGPDKECVDEVSTVELSETIYAPFDPEAIYHMAWYQVLDETGGLSGEEGLWYYKIGSGTNPLLNVLPVERHEGSYYPMIPLRRNNVDMTREDKRNTELYITSKRLIKRIGMDIDDLAEVINSNPDVGEIDHAYLYCGITLKADTPAAHRYLALYFEHLHGIDKKNGSTNYGSKNTASVLGRLVPGFAEKGGLGNRRIRIEDAGLKLELAYKSISVNTRWGKIGKVGHATRSFKESRTSMGFTTRCSSRKNGDYCRTVENYVTNYILTYQVQITPRLIKEVVVVDPGHINYVYGDRHIFTDANQAINDEDDNFIIPLHSSVVDKLSVQQRNELYYDSLHLVFNSIKKVKTKWYQSAFFKFVMVSVAIVAAAFGAPELGAAIVAAASAGAYAFAIFVLKSVLIAIATRYAFKLIAQLIGPVAAMILAVVAIAVSFGTAGTTEMGMLGSIPNSQLLLQAGNGLLTGTSSILSDELKEIMGEASGFAKEVKEKEELLESAQKLLETDGIIDPFAFIEIKPMVFPHETPEEYFFRVSHIGNIGVEVLDSVRNYVDRELILPETNPFEINEVVA